MKKLLLIFALFFTSTLAYGQTYQNQNSCGTSSSSSPASCTTSNVSVTAGQFAVLGIQNSGNTTATLTVSDHDGDIFTDCGKGVLSNSGSQLGNTEAYCGTLLTTDSTETFTFTTSGGSGSRGVVGGVVTISTGAVDQTDGQTYAATTTPTTPSVTTTTATELLVGICGALGTGGNSFTAGGSYTMRVNKNYGPSIGIETQAVSSTGAYTAPMTLNNSQYGACFIVTVMAPPPQTTAPTMSPNGIALDFATSHTVTFSDSQGSVTFISTTDGTTPTSNSSCVATNGTAGSTVSISSLVTVKVIGCASGYVNSTVTSAVFNLLPDQTIATDNLGQFYNPILNIDAINSIPTQLPLDTPWTVATLSSTLVSEWAGMGTGSGFYAYPAMDAAISGGFGMRGSQASFGYATRTAETYSANQFSKMSYHAGGGSQAGISVGTNCAAGSASTGNRIDVTGAASNNLSLYINGSLSTTITLAPSEADSYEMRQYGAVCQPLKNGVQITGLSATYACTAATQPVCAGAQGIASGGSYVPGGAVGYTWVGGNVGGSSTVTPISYTGNTYSNYASGTITSGTTLTYPTWMPDGTTGSSFPLTGTISGNWGNALGGQYALGATGNSSGDIHQAHLLAPFQNVYWAHQFATMDATAWNNGNNFLKLVALPYNPPSAMPPNVSGCYDAGALYCGTEPMMQGSVSCGASVEYCNTHKLHCTYANNGTVTLATSVVGMTGTSVTSVTLSNPRTVSTSTATVYFWGGVGTGATGTATMTAVTGGYQVTALTITAGGSYTVAPNVTIVPGSGGTQACAAIANYEIATAVGFQTAVMHGDEVLGVWNQTTGNLSVYIKGGSTIGGWTASTTITPRVNSQASPDGTTGTTIQEVGLYQVAISDLFQASFTYPLNAYIFDGTNWQQVTTTTGPTGGSAPTWNSILTGTTTSGSETFTNRGPHPSLGTCTDPCTATTQPAVWGGTSSTCETNTKLGALTPDNTAIWQCVGESATNDTAFQLLGTVNVPGFSGAAGFPGIWANNNSQTGHGEFAFQDVEFGSGNPCTNGKYTCVGGSQYSFTGWVQ